MLKGMAIVGLSVLVCVVYGVLHDQVTARLCLEYFTIGHPKLLPFETSSPTLLGLAWGVVATWWVGVLLGVPLALVSRLGRWPKRDAGQMLWPLLRVTAFAAAIAVIAGIVGWMMADRGWVILVPPLSHQVPEEKHTAFLINLWAHSGSYLGGFLGGAALILKTIWGRWREHRKAAADDASNREAQTAEA